MRSLFFILLPVVLFSCGALKKVPKVEEEAPAKTAELIEFYQGNQLDYSTLSYNAKMDYQSESFSIGFDGTFRMIKDELIWGSFKKFGFEAARLKITPDSLWVLNRFPKEVIVADLSNVQSVTGVPLTFQDIEQLLIGGSFLVDDLVMVNDSTLTQSKTIKGEIIEAIHTFNSNMDIYESSVTSQKQGDMQISYDNHQVVKNTKLAFNRDIKAKNSGTAVNLSIQTQNIDIDPSFETPFDIPSNYTRRTM